MLEAAAPVSNRHRRSVRFVALERQHVPIEHKLHGAFTRLICSSAYTLGEEVERFEADFAAYSEVEQCVGVASGAGERAVLNTRLLLPRGAR
jgi:dTDP-4-amino-4,6-dideoxygalactose transaminase